LQAQTYVVSTSSGSFYRINITSSAGYQNLTYRLFSRPSTSGALARLLPSIFQTSAATTNPQYEPANVNSVAIGASTDIGTDVWALVDTRIQKWNMSREGWEELVLDEEAVDAIRGKLRSVLGRNVPSDDAKLDLELVDLRVDLLEECVLRLNPFSSTLADHLLKWSTSCGIGILRCT
jgi:nuclear pore complex protein Nup133